MPTRPFYFCYKVTRSGEVAYVEKRRLTDEEREMWKKKPREGVEKAQREAKGLTAEHRQGQTLIRMKQAPRLA